MTDIYPFAKRYWYPHMMPEDVAIWQRFIEAYPDAYDTVAYDVKVGEVPDFVAGHEDEAMQAQGPLYQRKIDVVGYKGDQIDIIELKPRASTSAFGQVNAYRHLFELEYSPPEKPRAIVMTDQLLPQMEMLAAAAGVEMIVV